MGPAGKGPQARWAGIGDPGTPDFDYSYNYNFSWLWRLKATISDTENLSSV